MRGSTVPKKALKNWFVQFTFLPPSAPSASHTAPTLKSDTEPSGSNKPNLHLKFPAVHVTKHAILPQDCLHWGKKNKKKRSTSRSDQTNNGPHTGPGVNLHWEIYTGTQRDNISHLPQENMLQCAERSHTRPAKRQALHGSSNVTLNDTQRYQLISVLDQLQNSSQSNISE